MKLFGPNELLTYVVERDLCCGCGACIDLCPYFKSYKGKTVMLFPCTLGTGRCFAYCPKAEVDLDRLSQELFGTSYDGTPLGHYVSIKMSRAGEALGAGPYQAGGTVSAIVQFALTKGVISGAILTDREGILPCPRLVTSPDDVAECASSKYTAAPTVSALNGAVKDGRTQLGIVSTPCQTTAVAKMRTTPVNGNPPTDPTGLVVGLFCTWALDYRAFEAFLTPRVDISRIRKIDIPPPPHEHMEIFLDDEKREFPLDQIRTMVPQSCAYCIDMTSEFSDISVGVMEGRPDMNTLIIRTERGRKIVEDAENNGFLALSDVPQENLEHLEWAAANKKKRALRQALEKGVINNSNNDEPAYLTIRPEILNEIIH